MDESIQKITWHLIKIPIYGSHTILDTGTFFDILEARDLANRGDSAKALRKIAKLRRKHKQYSSFCAYGMRIKRV